MESNAKACAAHPVQSNEGQLKDIVELWLLILPKSECCSSYCMSFRYIEGLDSSIFIENL